MKKRGIVFMGIAVITVFLNILAWNSTAFSDWYIVHIFPLWVNTYGRITGIFPFSVGEWLIAAGLVLLATALIFLVLLAGVGIIRLIRENLCRKVLPVCEGILSVLFLGASVRLPDYDPELLYPVPCFQLFRKIFRRKYRGADPGTVDYCLQSGGGKL